VSSFTGPTDVGNTQLTLVIKRFGKKKLGSPPSRLQTFGKNSDILGKGASLVRTISSTVLRKREPWIKGKAALISIV
jgi:hypothetical protein